MKPIHDMSDEELCEAISEVKNKWNSAIVNHNSYKIESGVGSGQFTPTIEQLPINWLAWENAGKLFDEMPSPCLGPRHHDDHEYMCKAGSHTSEAPCRAPTPTRAIAEAWYQWILWKKAKA